MSKSRIGTVLAAGLVLAPLHLIAEVTPAQYEMYERILRLPDLVKGGTVEPVWRADGRRFVHASEAAGEAKWFAVDPQSGTREVFLEPARLQSALAGKGIGPQGVPFRSLSFVEGDAAVRLRIEDRWFDLNPASYALRELTPEEITRLKRLEGRVTASKFPAGGSLRELPSPKQDLLLRTQGRNLWIRSIADDRLVPLTDDGVERYGWSDGAHPLAGNVWSPDGHTVAAFKVDSRKVHYMPVVHWLKRREEISYHMYAQAGGDLPQQQLHFVDVLSGEKVPVTMGEDATYLRSVGWHPNGREFLFFWLSRNAKRLELRAAHRTTGAVRVLWSEESPTFVVATMQFFTPGEPKAAVLRDGRLIVASERSGWNHLYLYGPGKAGNLQLLAQLTKGNFPVLDIVRVDEKSGWVYFTAHSDPGRLYDTHLMRVRLDGRELTQLTEGAGQHQVQLSPSGEYFLDTHSTVARPAVTELRRADGKLVMKLESADAGELTRLGWQPPEEVVVKAADGKTDLYGIVHKPWNFDAGKKYPVVEYIYAGPQVTNVPRTFVPERLTGHMVLCDALAQLGFITLIVDGRGTPERGKAFLDVVYGNLGRYEVADHAAALRAIARTRPHMDLDRVGIFGTSYGGYFTTRALLQAPDLYKVGVASAPAVHLNSPFALAIENYMGGRPQDVPEAYDYANNLLWVDRLQGKLLILQPTSDVNVPFSQVVQLAEALIKAGKRYDMNILPEGNHGFVYHDLPHEHEYWRKTVRDYLVEHLKP